MSRARPVVVALLSLALVVATAGPTALATAGTVAEKEAPGPLLSPGNETPNALGVDAERSSFGSPNLSVTKSLRMQQSALSRELTRRTLENHLAAAPNETARQRVLLNATDRLANRTDALHAKLERANRDYRQGELTAAEYATRVGVVHSRASNLVELAQYVHRQAESETVLQRVRHLRAELSLLTGSARATAAAQVRGASADHRFYVGVGSGSVALAYLDDGRYVRDATRMEFYTPDRPGIPGLVEQLNHAKELYPWVFNNTAGSSTLTPFPPYAYVVDVPHTQGYLVSYIGSTGAVYHEEQRLVLDRLPVERDLVVTQNNTTLAVDRTYAGGPLYVNVTNATGAPLDARIAVANETVGRTGADGTLWTLSPDGEYVVTARVDGVTINATVSTTERSPSVESRGSAAER